jgi:hypothetical protein
MWFRGSVKKIWDGQYKLFDYVRQPLTNQEENEWRNAGYTNKEFTGLMYDSTNPMPDYCNKISEQIGLINCGYVFYKMTTGIVMPTHIDHFSRYCKVFNVEKNQVWRAIVFLNDWSPGHYFEIDGNSIMHYKAGEYILWANNTPHAASNIGLIDRYTLQITGQWHASHS